MEDISLISFLPAGHGGAPSMTSLPAQGDPSHCPTTPSSLKDPGITTVCKCACAHTCACPCVHVCALWSPGERGVCSPQATVPHPRGPSSKLCKAHPPLFPEDISSPSSGVSRTHAHEASRDAPGEQWHARQVIGHTAPAAGPAKAARSKEPRTPRPYPGHSHRGPEGAVCPQQLGWHGRGAINAAGVTSTGSDWTPAPPGALSAGQGGLSKEVQAVSPKGNQP